MHVLMIGATGHNASLVLPELNDRGVTVRALVRDPAKTDAALEAGAAEAVVGDLRDHDSLRKAAAGVDGVFHLNPAFAPDEADLGVAMVRAAEAAGVEKFVFSSVYHPSLSLTNHAAKRPVEEALYASDLTFAVLQPAMFMQNLAGLLGAARSGTLVQAYSVTSQMTYVDYRDVAEAAAIAMTESRLDGGTFELSAPGMVDATTIASLFADRLGHPVEARREEFDHWADQAGMPAGELRDGLKRMNEHYDQHGFHGGNSLVLETILGRAPRTVGAYVSELVENDRT